MPKKHRPMLEHLDDVIKQSQNNIIFFGTVGAGKTTLVNKLCNSEFKTLSYGDSCTKDIQYAFSIIHNMVIIDFPGLKSTENIMSHLKIQKTAIQNIPVKMICFIIQVFDRIGPIKNEIDDMIKIFENYKKNITIIITKTDTKANFNDNDKIKNKIIKDIDKFFGIKNIIFSHSESNGYTICKELNEIQKTMENMKNISIKTESIVNTINYSKNPEIECKNTFYEKKFNDIFNDHIKELSKHKESDLKVALYFCFKCAKMNLLEEYAKSLENVNFQEKTDDEDNENQEEDDDEKELEQISTAMLQFDNLLYDKSEQFRKNIEKDIEIKNGNYNNEYNKFKKCPYCKQIWFKIIGCNSMTCGSRSKILDKISGSWKEYDVDYNYETRSFNIRFTQHNEDRNREIDTSQTGISEEEKKQNPLRKLKGKAEIKPVGCGRQLDWAQMEDCTESVLKLLQENSLENDYYSDTFNYYDKLKKSK